MIAAEEGRSALRRRLLDRAQCRLTEHFFLALFDFGIFSETGADSFKHMLAGVVAGLIAAGFWLLRIYSGKYSALWAGGSSESYQHAVLGDDLFLIGLPMLLVAFVTLLISHSLFPDERDFRILGPLPVRKVAIFTAKLTALLLFTGSLTMVVHLSLAPLMLLTSMSPWGEHAVLSRLIVWAITSVGASMFAMLAVTALAGLLVLAPSRDRLHELTGIFKSGLLLVLVICGSLVLRLPNFGAALVSGSAWLSLAPPAWFVGLQQVLRGSRDPWFLHLAGVAVAALGTAVVLVAAVYTVLFRGFERLMLKTAAGRPPGSEPQGTAALADATPAFRAVYWFILLTLRRSPLHQGVLVGLSACGVGMAMNGLIEAKLVTWLRASGPASSALTGAAIWMPFALMFVCGLGVRAALVLPMEQRANWVFRLSEDRATRREQLRAVDRLVTAYVIGVPFAAAFPIFYLTIGSSTFVALAVVVSIGLAFVHAVLLDWRRIPFTCSYLPGKRFVGHSIVLGFTAYLLFTATGTGLVRLATAAPQNAAIVAAVLFAAAYALKRRRLHAWSETPLMFEDEFPDQPQQLGL